MKRVLCILFLSISSLLAVPQHQAIDMRLDNVGDADISMKLKFDAQAWQMWKSSVGENPSVMKREINRQFSTITLEDFSMDRNDLEREVTVNFHAVGLARYLGDGRWEADVETDDNDPSTSVSRRKVSDTAYLTTATVSEPGMGVVMQQEITVFTPEGASALKEATSETGSDLIRYQLAPDEAGNPTKMGYFAAGGVCSLAGVILLVSGRKLEK